MCRTGEGCHVRSDLGNQTPGCHALDPGNGDPAGHCVSQFLVLLTELLQPGVERLDLGFEEAILAQQAIQQEPVVITNATVQRQLEFRDLAAQLTQGETGQSLRTVLAPDDRV